VLDELKQYLSNVPGGSAPHTWTFSLRWYRPSHLASRLASLASWLSSALGLAGWALSVPENWVLKCGASKTVLLYPLDSIFLRRLIK